MELHPRERAPRAPAWFLVLGLLIAAAWLPARGEIVYARRDMHDGFMPDLALHVRGNHGFGPALWAPQVQLGRPAFQKAGLTPAYWPCFLASLFVGDEWWLHTVLVVATLVLGGLFAYGLFRELELHPWPAAACALGFGFSSFHGHIGEQLFYLNGSVWGMGLVWALAANLRRPSAGRGLLYALMVHSALLSAYPQQLIWAAWFGLFLLPALLPARGQRRRAILHVAAWSAVGLLSAAPYLLDLAERAQAAARAVMVPELRGTRDLRVWLASFGELADPFWNGRKPLGIDGPTLWGATLTPFFGAAVLFAVAMVRTRLVFLAAAFVVATLVLSFSPAAYRFAAHHLGGGVSSFLPFGAANAAIFLLAALGFDRAWRLPGRLRRAAVALVLPILAWVGSSAVERPLDASHVAVSCALAACAAVALVRPSPAFLAFGAALAAAQYGVGGLSTRPRPWLDRVLAHFEPAADELRATAGGGRLAMVGTTPPPWPAPNAEIFHGLESIHSYDSLTPRRFLEWVRRVSAKGVGNRDRAFLHVMGVEGLASEEFRRACVGCVASYEPLDSPELRPAGRIEELRWFDVRERYPREAWVPLAICRTAPGSVSIPAPLPAHAAPVRRHDVLDEHVELFLEPRDEPGVVWSSQQFHPHWRARSGDRMLETVPIDELWQGVLVPPGTERITLEFRPWIRWWWLPQLGFAAAGAGFFLHRVRSRGSTPGLGSGCGPA